MKRIIFILVFDFAICGLVFAQSPLADLDKARCIKLLEATRENVVRIIANDIFPVSDISQLGSKSYYYERFYTEDAVVSVSYSSGKCSEEDEDWNVPEWRLTEITVAPKDLIKIQDIGIDYSKFRKERLRKDYKDLYVYHDKKAGIAIIAYGDRVEFVIFTPSEKDFSLLCDKPEVKKYYSGKKWLRDPAMKNATYHNFPPPKVVGLDLSQNEIIIGCDSVETMQNKSCAEVSKEISVSTSIVNPMNDAVFYAYYISGGKIVGRGAKVVWDLSGVKVGTYKITAVADNGCGPCGRYLTKTVVVKECHDCLVK